MEKEKNCKITLSKIKKYYDMTNKALKIAKKSIMSNKEIEAHEITLMAESYLSDSQYFAKKRDLVNAFACLNYAHGWIDCGARLKVFDVKDNRLFSV